MEQKKEEILKLLAEGKVTRKYITDNYVIDGETLDRWEQSGECEEYRQSYLNKQKMNIIENLSLLTNKLIKSIEKTADDIPPKESLEMLLKLLEKAEKLGLPILDYESDDEADISLLNDTELKDILKKYFAKKDKK